MVDAALIQQCADPGLKPAIVEQFIERAGSQDPLAVTVRSGNRVVLVPKPTTPDEAMELIRQNIGRNSLRVGITQYPAGLGIMEAGELKPDIVDACANLKMGTALFAKVYRIVMKWYGNPTDKEALPQVFDDAIIAWQSGYFEGTAVFRAPDPGGVEVAEPDKEEPTSNATQPSADSAEEAVSDPVRDEARDGDPNKAGIRVNLSGIGAE
ncbi:conjugal transfer protein TraH [Agrobacterium tumefaciens]|uniref:Conjugal transfer protein TraH n=2 Tax=Alphaproteobacteria TaxID=28211 RepID=A0A512HKL3_9HYPH|nr:MULTISPECIES: TraH family protein [Alphaproteobacteria]NTE55370.1 conjugal transfer protein TraH [Agrobacterium tumefaciens]NTE72726.1 conjugal transfer protein TraH [Agrobacterium tumefaciens]GEO85985.1 conjugal transfer protein TraH [Ciceribacter naphthalenivorans]GLR23492.1 conjugal transfer protein TraH [Ciceribacter naphthalenivorans]GLT06348.1 conjugal transfer protein TraH [Sphingomonas psychrolutea]